MVGQCVAHYAILDKLGEGGMGIVYKARDNHLNRIVALKVLPADKVADPDRRRRFVLEARVASALSHPNIVSIYDIDTADDVTFIAMEYISGKTLDRFIRGKREVRETLRYALQIADALLAAHAAGILHRDIKPANVMVTDAGQVKVLDFGLAKLTEAAGAGDDQTTQSLEAQPTKDGAILGTPAYMSPEQAEGKPADARSEIFSFGAVLYEMMTGERAFERGSAAATLAAILCEQPAPPGERAGGLPPELERLIIRCLRKEPGERYQHMDQVRAVLEMIQSEVESGRTGARKPALRLTRVVAVLTTLMAAAFVPWYWSRGPDAPPQDLRAVPLMADLGLASSPSFSPDGNKVAFAWQKEDEHGFDIYVSQIGASAPPLRLTSDPATERSPAWSPDDRYIAFERLGTISDSIVLISPLGGPERKIAELPAGGLGEGLSWTPDGKWLAAPIRSAHGEAHSIWGYSVETGEQRRLTTAPKGTAGDSYPAISADGRNLAFSRELNSFVRAPYVLSLSRQFLPDGAPRELTSERYPTVDGIAWTGDGRAVIYAGGAVQTRGLFWLPTSRGGNPVRLAYAIQDAFHPAVDARHSRLAWEWSTSSVNLWRLDTQTGRSRRLLGSNWEQRVPQYSPDGHRIAFMSNRSGEMAVWTCDGEGANCAEVTKLGTSQGGTPRWSPDGRWQALDWRVEGQSEI